MTLTQQELDTIVDMAIPYLEDYEGGTMDADGVKHSKRVRALFEKLQGGQ